MTEAKEFLTVSEIAEKFGVTRQTVDQRIHKREINMLHIGKLRVLRRNDLWRLA